MGFAPPTDYPSPEEQGEATANASFEPSPTGAKLCGFGLPVFAFSFSLPGFQFPPEGFPPQLNYGIALKCNLSDPIDAEFGFGGGRVSNSDPSADRQFEDG
jgi:hypothetical protein